MSQEGHWVAYTAYEADAMERLELNWSMLSACGRDLRDAGAPADLVRHMDDAAGDVLDAERGAIHARLVRVLPHLADVIANACWPEHGTTPEWLTEEGMINPIIHPTSRHLKRELKGMEGKE